GRGSSRRRWIAIAARAFACRTACAARPGGASRDVTRRPRMTTRKPATAEEIRAIIGPAEDGLIAGIMATGATAAEVLEAFTWNNADDALGRELNRAPRGTVAEVCDILLAEE